MPKYFFDVTDAGVLSQDQYGVDLASDDEARNESLSLLPAIAREALLDGDQHEFRVSVRDEAGTVVYEAILTLNGRWCSGRR